MPAKRRYELRKRAEQVAETRRRITEATLELHRTVGPAATRVSEIAERAGVERVTVYSHFPDDAALLAACSAHWRALHPAPDLAAFASEHDGERRARVALAALYRWYRETEPMTANVLRDAQLVPALRPIVDRGLGRYLRDLRELVAAAFRVRGRRAEAVRAATLAASELQFWRALSPLGDDRAADLGAAFIAAAARA